MNGQGVDASAVAWGTPQGASIRLSVNGQRVELTLPNVYFGRAPGNEVVLDPNKYTMTSGRHARIGLRDGLWWIEDLKSTNGTYVNGEAIAYPRRLYDADVVCFGPPGFDGVATVEILSGAGARSSRESGKAAGVSGPAPVAPGVYAPQVSEAGQGRSESASKAEDDRRWNPFKRVAKVYERIKTRREIQREIREIEDRLPGLRAAAERASAALGMAAWSGYAAAMDGLPGAAQLQAHAGQMQLLQARLEDAERKHENELRAWEAWESDWKQRRENAESRTRAVEKECTECRVELQYERERLLQALSVWREAVAGGVDALEALRSELDGEPSDEVVQSAQRAGVVLQEVGLQLGVVPSGVEAALKARGVSRRTMEQAERRVEEARVVRAGLEAERTEAARVHQDQMRTFEVERNEIQRERSTMEASLSGHFAALGRQLAQEPRGGADALAEFGAAVAALVALTDAEGGLEDLRRSLAEAS
ncbi:MAG: FHA domain-containing protein [Phycisphaeraceae bacterium]|nr:FHA domain-containing protein [Phycisphaeraceae bacterium]MCW5755319.1 FHA domain-containing protein [Phycisphaeraceae bacterium]